MMTKRLALGLFVGLVGGLVAVQPAFAQVTVTSALQMEHTATPGGSYQGAITIRNASETVRTATLSLADYRFTAAGSNSFDAPGSHARSNTPWITLSQNAVSLPPKSSQVVGYTVKLPAGGAAQTGTFWSVVLVEAEDRSASAATSAGFTVSQKIRYAVQLVTHIGQTGDCRLVFGSPTVQPGKMAIDVTGAGTRGCRPNLKLEVYTPEGALQHTATIRGNYLYPDTSNRQTFALAPLTPGAYSFLVVADVGAEKLQGARFTVQVR